MELYRAGPVHDRDAAVIRATYSKTSPPLRGTGDSQRIYRQGEPVRGAISRSSPGWPAAGAPRLPAGKSAVKELDLGGVEFAAAVLLPLGMDPHSESVLMV